MLRISETPTAKNLMKFEGFKIGSALTGGRGARGGDRGKRRRISMEPAEEALCERLGCRLKKGGLFDGVGGHSCWCPQV